MELSELNSQMAAVETEKAKLVAEHGAKAITLIKSAPAKKLVAGLTDTADRLPECSEKRMITNIVKVLASTSQLEQFVARAQAKVEAD